MTFSLRVHVRSTCVLPHFGGEPQGNPVWLAKGVISTAQATSIFIFLDFIIHGGLGEGWE